MLQVKEAMAGLWSRHLQSHSTWQKIQVEIEKWTDRSDKSLEILQSSLSEHNPTKNLIIHHFKLVRNKAFAEALLAKLRSQVQSIPYTVGIQNTGHLNSRNVCVPDLYYFITVFSVDLNLYGGTESCANST